ncbi:hypothetical protein POTOM_030299 [Populus tomentosa]|uniref:Photolyase/cryptochrome alpha/beta domain-containing protein n=1 Tax=Populus tomentosa TaxID=118781 RepID=A0A8X7Z8F3_POPTO|nr:hypothetical protein POTOM_030299 [Populus tomentosa]
MSSSKTIVWFRRDLRIEDNPALAASARDGCVFPVFICCPKEGQFYPGRVSRWWLKQSFAPSGKSLEISCYNGDLLYEPWEIYDERGYAFTTFEAYRDKCLHMQMEPVSHLPPRRSVPAAGTIVMCSVEELGLEDEAEKSSNSLVGRGWSPGWGNADKALAEFVHFKAWRQGWTGYPLVEAGMHLESDIPGWQYISGSLPDAHELERLDNPEIAGLWLNHSGIQNCYGNFTLFSSSLMLHENIHPLGEVIVESCGNDIHGALHMIQGSKFEPEGEYVRCWLPELTRMPAEWIHHTGDAPITALIVAVVELGVNYPKPIIDIDFCYRASSESYIQDVGNGSSRKSFKFKWNKGPKNQNYKNIPAHRKRSKFIEKERRQPYKLHIDDDVVGTSRKDEELCSAQSSASKKQATSRCSFSVRRCCSSSECKPSQECESSDLKQSWEAHIEMEQSSCKDGKQLHF